MNSLRLCGGSAAMTATLVTNRTSIRFSLRIGSQPSRRTLAPPSASVRPGIPDAEPAEQPDQCASGPAVTGSHAHQAGPARAPAGPARAPAGLARAPAGLARPPARAGEGTCRAGEGAGRAGSAGRTSSGPALASLSGVEDLQRVERVAHGGLQGERARVELAAHAVALEDADAVLAGDGAAERDGRVEELLERGLRPRAGPRRRRAV